MSYSGCCRHSAPKHYCDAGGGAPINCMIASPPWLKMMRMASAMMSRVKARTILNVMRDQKADHTNRPAARMPVMPIYQGSARMAGKSMTDRMVFKISMRTKPVGAKAVERH